MHYSKTIIQQREQPVGTKVTLFLYLFPLFCPCNVEPCKLSSTTWIVNSFWDMLSSCTITSLFLHAWCRVDKAPENHYMLSYYLLHTSYNLWHVKFIYMLLFCNYLTIASSVLGLLHHYPDCFLHDPHHYFLLLPLLSEETMQPKLHGTEAWVWRM